MSCNVAFIGLGVMGYPMAGYISKGGHNVTVYNRTGAKADKWLKDFKGKKADTPKDAAKDADYIFTCVGNDNDLRRISLKHIIEISSARIEELINIIFNNNYIILT